jgi:hypothetical protein
MTKWRTFYKTFIKENQKGKYLVVLNIDEIKKSL